MDISTRSHSVVRAFLGKTAFWAGAIAVLLFVTARADANTIVFDNALQAGSQSNWVLGMDFIVNNAVTVTQLGAFDENGDGFHGSTITVGIFDVVAGTLVGTSASFTGMTGTLIGGSRFVSVVPFTLNAGTRYSIVATGFTATDQNGNTGLGGFTSFNSVGGALSMVSKGGRWDVGSTFQLPTQNLGGYGQSDPVFQAGTFAVPDGGMTISLLGAAMVGLAMLRRKLHD